MNLKIDPSNECFVEECINNENNKCTLPPDNDFEECIRDTPDYDDLFPSSGASGCIDADITGCMLYLIDELDEDTDPF